MSREFLRKYARTKDCPRCGKAFTNKGIKQHMRKCRKWQPKHLPEPFYAPSPEKSDAQ